jgi:hypothetical protein
MVNPVRKYVVAVCTTLMLGGGMVAPAAAQTQQDGLVNINVENNEILSRNDVAIGVAANIAANLCNVKVGPIAVLATQVDRSSQDGDVDCSNVQGDPEVTITQNQ